MTIFKLIMLILVAAGACALLVVRMQARAADASTGAQAHADPAGKE